MPRAKKPKATKPRKKPAPVDLLPPGELIARVEIPHRAVPWKVPLVLRSGRSVKDASLVTWQRTVALFARVAMCGREPYAGPVRLRFVFELEKRPGSYPDCSNATKSTEDGLQGVVFDNDRQVVGNSAERIIGDRDHTLIEVFSA